MRSALPPGFSQTLTAYAHAQARLSEPSDLLVCGDQAGRVLGAAQGGGDPHLLATPGELTGAICFRSLKEALAEAIRWNAGHPHCPLEVMNLNAALARALGVHRRAPGAPNVINYVPEPENDRTDRGPRRGRPPHGRDRRPAAGQS